MNFFYVLNGKTIKQILIIGVAAFFTAWFLFLGNMYKSRFFQQKMVLKLFTKERRILH